MDRPRPKGLLTAAVTAPSWRAFGPVGEIAAEYGVTPMTDPDFELLAVNRARRVPGGAQFYALPPLTLASTRFCAGGRAATSSGSLPLKWRSAVIMAMRSVHGRCCWKGAPASAPGYLELYAQRCVQAKARAEKEVIWQLGDSPLPNSW